jgi:archaemetzincin
MLKKFWLTGCGVCLGLLAACGESGDSGQAAEKAAKSKKMDLPEEFAKLLPLHTRLGPPKPGEWLASHPESGQTYREYVECKPAKPDGRRRVIYVQPLGDFTATQRRIIDLTAEFMGIYFGLSVKTEKDLPLRLIPKEARRTHPDWGDKQILSTYVLDDVLKPRLPEDACAFIAFTSSDLWPGEGWNFVFGQASLRERVGVWSIYRNGDPEQNDAGFRLCLLRTLKTATHETGHMFSMEHCTLFECNMCGSNHRVESDARPLALCPHCLAKLCYATGVDPQKRFEKLIAFCKAQGLKPEQEFYEKSLRALRLDGR